MTLDMPQETDVDLSTRVQIGGAKVFAVPDNGIWVAHDGDAYQLFTDTHMGRVDGPLAEMYEEL